ncbi:Glycosyl transferase family 2 [Algibacter lectus]|uniref:glycosyltransferase family 2 protein n=1 Tax=Algibacter lectus TaxID=221126 RepID=UPI0008ECD534|nr:glycosyltransferase family A protein [Algibacter lectus]SFD29979.1 Glycosyl transferase family 2 [Algibacter lectus]
MKNILVSILIPIYNSEEWISDTLMSCLNQTHKNIEIILVDDGSTDNSLLEISKIKDSRVNVISQANKGACTARNLALKNSKGEWVQFLDADDIMHPQKIEFQLKAIIEFPNANFLVSDLKKFTGSLSEIDLKSTSIDPKFSKISSESYIYNSGYTYPIAILLKRELITNNLLWQEDLIVNQDKMFFLPIIVKVKNIVMVKNALSFYRTANTKSISGTITLKKAEVLLETYKQIAHLLKESYTDNKTLIPIKENLCLNYYGSFSKTNHLRASTSLLINELGGWTIPRNLSNKYNFASKILGIKTVLRLRHLKTVLFKN